MLLNTQSANENFKSQYHAQSPTVCSFASFHPLQFFEHRWFQFILDLNLSLNLLYNSSIDPNFCISSVAVFADSLIPGILSDKPRVRLCNYNIFTIRTALSLSLHQNNNVRHALLTIHFRLFTTSCNISISPVTIKLLFSVYYFLFSEQLFQSHHLLHPSLYILNIETLHHFVDRLIIKRLVGLHCFALYPSNNLSRNVLRPHQNSRPNGWASSLDFK